MSHSPYARANKSPFLMIEFLELCPTTQAHINQLQFIKDFTERPDFLKTLRMNISTTGCFKAVLLSCDDSVLKMDEYHFAWLLTALGREAGFRVKFVDADRSVKRLNCSSDLKPRALWFEGYISRTSNVIPWQYYCRNLKQSFAVSK